MDILNRVMVPGENTEVCPNPDCEVKTSNPDILLARCNTGPKPSQNCIPDSKTGGESKEQDGLLNSIKDNITVLPIKSYW